MDSPIGRYTLSHYCDINYDVTLHHQRGKTKMFLKYYHNNELAEITEKTISKIVVAQSGKNLMMFVTVLKFSDSY